ncbi:hypothetical protein DIURU_005818 [Diutina rugosa]|uniref:Uncharacterized protein n=1 Tax=Diutina rugosa TaxID=5481 RepID=A0A642UG79_DIURU|nr:uncharacterized protein DIURU_005818 [Diutina rugosa]KAA8896446.1 hypothetical protein DIURU_005818 [Diutina rugosa]
MVSTTGLSVGLAIGVPVFLIIVVLAFFWARNNRRQNKEFIDDDDVDLDLKDDASYTQFHHQLVKPMQPDDPPSDSQRSSTLTESVQRPQKSTYEFYETFIPVMQSDVSTASLIAPPPAAPTIARDPMSSTSDVSVPPSAPSSAPPQAPPPLTSQPSHISLDKLAKDLSHSEFFEKLPSKASAPASPMNPWRQPPAYRASPSPSTDILNNIVGETPTALNENFVYEAQLAPAERDRSRQLMRARSHSSATTASTSSHKRPTSVAQAPPPPPPPPHIAEEPEVSPSPSRPLHDDDVDDDGRRSPFVDPPDID